MNSSGKQAPAAWMTAFLCVAAASAEDRLTTDGAIKSDPVFVDSSGAELVYVVQNRPTQMRLMKLRLADGISEPLNPDQRNNEFEPAYSPNGKRLAFVQNRGNLSLALVIRDLAAGKETEVKPEGGFAGPRSPAVSPDGNRILYSFADGGRQSIYSVNAAAGDRKIVIDGAGIANWPSWSPDGKRIVFSSTRDGDYEIYTAGADGSDVRRLTASPGQDIRPRFSPDGRQIAFVSNRGGNYDIYVMNADGSDVRQATDNPERDDYPVWTPDGKHLIVVSERAGRHDLYRIAVPQKSVVHR